jgi:adenylate kinase family enzyme
MRLAIIGNSGSGKSTLARWLAVRHGLAMLDLDTVAWESTKIAVPRAQLAAEADVRSFCDTKSAWVVDGCYAGLIAVALCYQPILLFLEPGVEACLENCRRRPWEPHKYSSRQVQDANLEFLLGWVRDYYRRDGDMSLCAHQSVFAGYAGPKQQLAVLPEGELDDLLANLASR